MGGLLVALDAADELEKEIPFGGMIITAINILAGLGTNYRNNYFSMREPVEHH